MEITKEHTAIIKGVAICLMLWHHLFLQNESYGAFIQWTGLVGKVCVALFLFVSGYGLVKTYEQRVKNKVLGFKNKIIQSFLFLVRRFWKFYLSYWPMMICVIIVGVLCGYSLSDAYAGLNPWKRLGIEVVGLNGWYSYLGPWWFNKLIIQLWALFFIFYLLLHNKWISVLGGIALLLCEQFDLIPLFCFQEGGVFTFFLGMMMAKFDWVQPVKWQITLPIGIVIIGGLLMIWQYVPFVKFSIIHAAIALIICLLISYINRGGANADISIHWRAFDQYVFVSCIVYNVVAKHNLLLSFPIAKFRNTICTIDRQ